MRRDNNKFVFCVFLYLVASQCVLAAPTGKIKHIIVLMEENRSFDQMFGYYGHGVNGLTGKEFNRVNSQDANSQTVTINSQQPQQAYCDPDHGTAATAFKAFGPVAVSKNDYTNATMTGFIEWENKNGHAKEHWCGVMEMMSPEHVPVISALASEFVLMDRFFCDHPGPTWPNRLFMLTATSAGCTSTGTFYHDKIASLYPQKTFYDQILAEKLTYRHYYNDTPWEVYIAHIAEHPLNLAGMNKFYEDAKTGNLPNFAFINPRAAVNTTTGEQSNDQHPDHDVSLGEKYYKDIYEALRVSPQWNETLFIITYDEHGGFFDHVPTPVNVPPPGDGETSYPDKGFLFDRLGVRIPTLLISPWLPKGLIVSGPPSSQKPAANSEFTLTSIMATARKILGMSTGPLTKRDAWAATFEHLFTLTQPRTDCPLHLPEATKPYVGFTAEDEANLPINGLQEDIMRWHAALNGVEYPSHIQRQGDVGEWLQEQYRIHTERVLSNNN